MQLRILQLMIIMLTVLSAFSPGYADASNDEVNFQKLFTEWTNAFNQKQYPKVCHLFAKSVHADYQGSSQKNYAKICEGFRKIFQEKEMTYHNDFKIHHIYRSDDLAAVRITWYLNIYKNGKHMSFIQEEGLDIFQRQTNKKWEIINFIAYPVLSTQ